MNVYTFPSLFLAVTSLIIAGVIYYKNKSDYIVERFSIFLLAVSLWNIDIFGIRTAPSADYAEIWGKIFRNGLFLIPVAFCHFVLCFVETKEPHGPIRKLLIFFYALMGFFAIVNWTPFFTGKAVRYPWGYQIRAGPLYIYFAISYFGIMVFTIFRLIRNYFESDNYQKHRIKYFFLAVIISFVLGSLNFLPMFGLEVYPFGSIAVTIGLFIASYSIVQHRLMDVSVFMAKGLGYILSLALLAIPGGLALIFLEKYFFNRIDLLFSAISVMIGVIAAIIFLNIKGRIDQAMQQIIVKDKYFYHQILEEFSRHLVTIVDLKRLLNMLADTVERSMGVKRISIFLYNPEKGVFLAALVRGLPEENMMEISFKPGDFFVRWLREKEEAVLRAELERVPEGLEEEKALKVMKELQAEVCLPLIFSHRLVGFINLGHKSAQEMYYREDLDLLNSLANQVAMAIENANLYENLKKSQAVMRRADRLASLGTLTASLAHEIRNPLVAIKTFAQLLPERMDDEEFRTGFLNIASGSVDRISTLINELLSFARPSTPQLKNEDINEIVQKVELLITPEARKKDINLSSNFALHLPPVLVDGEQIKQVLLNVILNAIQAIEGKGEIWLETRAINITRYGNPERFVQIEIRDTGEGIPQENLERIFDPYFSTRPNGSGLGLSISHQIVQEHGGFFDVESEVGKGTSFRIHLPLRE